MFTAINTASSGLQTYQTWLDSIANNIANVNDTSTTSAGAFHQQYIVAQSLGGSGQLGDGEIGTGVQATQVVRSTQTQPVYDPSNPQADAGGYVYHSDVNLSEQMGDMIAAERAFQANANVVSSAQETYQAAMSIGKGI